jgi:uncharacterized protein
MGIWTRNKQAEPAPVIERVEPRIGVFGEEQERSSVSRADQVQSIMMAIRQRAINQLPQFTEQFREQFAMDGFDFEGSIAGGDFASPNMSEGVLMWYAQQSFVPSQMCAIVGQHWLVNKACSQMPRDAIRKGYKIIGDDGNELDPKRAKQIEMLDKRYGLKKNLVQFVRKGRMFGIRIALFMVRSRDPYYYEKPFNLDGVTPGSYRGIRQIDPYWTAPLLDKESASNPLSLRFYDPTYWMINGKKIHHSHFVVYINDEVADFLKPSYIYGGVPLPQQIMERIYAAERTANEGPMLAMTKRTTVLKGNAAKILANKKAFDEQMNWWLFQRDNYQVKVIDKQEEDLQQFDTALGDLDKVIMNQYQIVSAIARTPATKMMGTVPTGFNSSGDYEESSYNEECESVQENDYQPMIERHHQILARSAFNDRRLNVRALFNPLDAPTEAERADTNFKKMQTYKLAYDMNAIDGYDVNGLIISDPTMGMTGITPGLRGDEEEVEEVEGEPHRTIAAIPTPSVKLTGDIGGDDDEPQGPGVGDDD